MSNVWAIHGRRPRFEMVRDRVAVLERTGIGDLHAVGNDRGRVFDRLRRSYSDPIETKDETIQVWTTVLLRFAFEPTVGDLVVHPDPQRRTLSVGRITSAYRFDAGPPELHVRDVAWLVTDIPRDRLSDKAKQDISQRPAFFEVLHTGGEFASFAGWEE
jgi:predicted Mrr-cat superfamily restriction endonuclease